MASQQLSPTVKRWFIWSGAAWAAGLSIAVFVLMGFIPPTAPTWSAEQVVDFYVSKQTRILAGALIFTAVSALWALWVGVLVTYCRPVEGNSPPYMTYAMLVLNGASTCLTVLVGIIVAMAAYRPGEIDPDITLALNDAFWFMFLYSWPPFALFMVLLAVVIFSDKSAAPAMPRWAGYYNLWAATLMVSGGFMGFFKSGPFAYNGLMAFYVLAADFIIWVFVMTYVAHRAMARESHIEPVQRPTETSPQVAV